MNPETDRFIEPREQPPATDDKQEFLWDEKYVDERLGRDASWPQIIEAANYSINAALAAAENAEVQRLRDLAMQVQELKRQLASERGPLRELAETAAFDRAVGLTNKLHVEPLKQQLLQAEEKLKQYESNKP